MRANESLTRRGLALGFIFKVNGDVRKQEREGGLGNGKVDIAAPREGQLLCFELSVIRRLTSRYRERVSVSTEGTRSGGQGARIPELIPA